MKKKTPKIIKQKLQKEKPLIKVIKENVVNYNYFPSPYYQKYNINRNF